MTADIRKKGSLRERVLEVIGNFWWILLLIAAGGYLLTDIPIFQYFKYVIYAIGFGIALFIFLPFVFQFFSPAFAMLAGLFQHFREARNMPAGKKYIFIPMALVSAAAFVSGQFILSIWGFILAFAIWSALIGTFLTAILTILFGLAPIAMITAPFVAWYREGFVRFADVALFMLLPLILVALSKLAFTEDYQSTPEDFLGYSHHIFLLGALSLQVVALPFYLLGWFGAGEAIADAGGTVLILLALIAVFKWRSLRSKLSSEEREALYTPPGWVYVLGFLFTNIISVPMKQYGGSTVIITWLNVYFVVVLVGRFLRLFTRKGKVQQLSRGAIQQIHRRDQVMGFTYGRSEPPETPEQREEREKAEAILKSMMGLEEAIKNATKFIGAIDGREEARILQVIGLSPEKWLTTIMRLKAEVGETPRKRP